MKTFAERFKAAQDALSGKATKEQFAANILTAAGVDLEAAFTAGNTKALDDIFAKQDADISAAVAKAKAADDRVSKIEASLTEAGLDPKSDKSISEQVAEKVKVEASKKAVDISANRGIPPVSNVANAPVETREQLVEAYNAARTPQERLSIHQKIKGLK